MTSSSWSNLALVVVILVILASPEARSDGLVITVINEKHLGVVSSIIAKHDTEETIVGTTLPSGRLPSNKYKCSEDRSLIARPLDRSYFESPPAPCESPQNFLVPLELRQTAMSRLQMRRTSSCSLTETLGNIT